MLQCFQKLKRLKRANSYLSYIIAHNNSFYGYATNKISITKISIKYP